MHHPPASACYFYNRNPSKKVTSERTLSSMLVALSMFCVAALTALAHKPLASGDSEHTVRTEDQALVRAIGRGDKSALENLLDTDFTWTDRTGQTQTKSQFVQNFKKITASNSGLQARNYGAVMFFTGTEQISSQDVRFVRVWAKRPEGWRAILHQETLIAGKSAAAQAVVPAGTPCDNPCATVPYETNSAAANDVVASWRALETAVNKRDADGWAAHVADEFIFNVKENGNPLTKADRIAMIRKQAQGNTTTDIGSVVPGSMAVWVFGDAAVMTDKQQPTVGGNPYHAMRVWVKRDGRWQLAYSQQTAIQRPS
jgi:ketosteroid isomerase-like protein